MKPGDLAERTRRFTAKDVEALSRLTGAPLRTGLVAEPFIHAMFSDLLGMDLPGQGANYLKQEIRFLAPAPLGEPLTARVEITRLRPDKHLVDLATTCRTEDGSLIADGRALIYAKDVSGAFD
ncbi:phosphate acetyltransferase [Hyphobacterium marinum]|uniref:Phosphate acetyltransferase n=1 Tax=Hyphobacterium marinum TaxID=3116574 RepID=A0ABU7LVT0_9PROT|nr:phosphate acetyltransferase [Hyphobacterium sp. Y6023]MEE2565671.1 phosphate acetyltransferase [Hyphobacterium sp. Y6023]